MKSLHELRMRRMELQEELARVSCQIERLEQVEYREWQQHRRNILAATPEVRPGAITVLSHCFKPGDISFHGLA